MRGEPAALDDVGEAVLGGALEIHPDRRGHADHPLAVEHAQLPVREHLDVVAVVLRLEALLVGQGGEDDPLQLLEPLGVLRAGPADDQAPRQLRHHRDSSGHQTSLTSPPSVKRTA